MTGGVDICDLPLTVAGADVLDLVVTFTDVRTRVRGRVLRDATLRTSPGWVVVFSTDPRHWRRDHVLNRRVALIRMGLADDYVTDLPPGGYFVAAVDAVPVGGPTREIFEQLSRLATRVWIGERDTAVHDAVLRPWQ
jgi:hypothetical protein